MEVEQQLEPRPVSDLRKYRQNRGWTQNEVARAVGISRIAYLYIERGARPSPHMAERIRQTTGFDGNF